MGTPDFALPALAGLVDEGYNVVSVYTRPDARAGRGRNLLASPVKQLAEARGLRVIQPASLSSAEESVRLTELNPDIIVVAAYGLILPERVLAIPRLGCVNIHASLLPRYRGAAPIAAAVASGDRFSGVSIMQMDKGIDTGDVFTRAQTPVFDYDTTGSLTRRLAIIGAALLLDILPQITSGTVHAQPQPETNASYAPMMTKEYGVINWSETAEQIWRRIRAVQPWPGATTRYGDTTLKLLETVPLDIPNEGPAGTVVAVPAGSPAPWAVSTGKGLLGVLRLQSAGKRPVSGAEFLRGQRNVIGSNFNLPEG